MPDPIDSADEALPFLMCGAGATVCADKADWPTTYPCTGGVHVDGFAFYCTCSCHTKIRSVA